jgi:D-amino-acid dehydrogenase
MPMRTSDPFSATTCCGSPERYGVEPLAGCGGLELEGIQPHAPGIHLHVVVVGGGLIGLSTAYFLLRRGAAVTVVERRDGPGRETSFANGGMMTPSMAEPWNSPNVAAQLLRSIGRRDAPLVIRLRAVPSLRGWGIRFLCNSMPSRFDRNTVKNIKLSRYSIEACALVRQETGIAYERSPTGTLRIFRRVHSLEQAARRAEFLRNHGVSFEVLDRARTVSLEPALGDVAAQLAGSIYFRDDEVGNAQLFCEGVASAVRAAGGQLLFDTVVTGWRRRGARLDAALTAQHALTADAFVLAAGSYSPALVRSLGMRVPVQPAKGYSVTIPAPSGAPRVPVIDDALHAAVVPIGPSLRLVGTAEFAGFDLKVAPARMAALLALLDQLYPGIFARADHAAARSWTGLRPMSADGVPILGRTAIENLYINTGHGPLGWSMAAGSGRAVADLISGADPEIDLRDYSLARFS